MLFNNLEYYYLDETTLRVKDVTRDKINESLLLNSLENDLDNQEPENHEQIFNTSKVQSSSTKVNGNKGNYNLKLLI